MCQLRQKQQEANWSTLNSQNSASDLIKGGANQDVLEVSPHRRVY